MLLLDLFCVIIKYFARVHNHSDEHKPKLSVEVNIICYGLYKFRLEVICSRSLLGRIYCPHIFFHTFSDDYSPSTGGRVWLHSSSGRLSHFHTTWTIATCRWTLAM